MDAQAVAAVIFAVAALGAVGFQFALAAGAPWGDLAMGGRFPGRFPVPMRIAAAAQALVLVALAGIVIARAGLALEAWAAASSWMIWVVVAFSATSLAMNSLSRSKGERRLWVPIAIVMLASSLVVALAG